MISSRTVAIYSAIVALAMTVLMPSNQSLWIDEAQTFQHVAQPTLRALASGLLVDQKSEALMPLGMFLAWLSGKVIGTSEWQLRAPNILWAALAVIAFIRLGVLWRAPWAPLIIATQPFLWFYVNEARPYAFQIASGAWLTVGCAGALASRRLDGRTILILTASSAALAASTLFGIVTVGVVALALTVLCWRESWMVTRPSRSWITVVVLWCGVFGLYYTWRVASGAKGAKIWSVGLQNLAFAAYEFAGFTGFGPARDELRKLAREGGLGAAIGALGSDPVWIALLSLLLCIVSAALVAAWKSGEQRRDISHSASVCTFVWGATFALASAAKFPFWGRHLAPVFPFYCALLVLGLKHLWHSSWPAVVRTSILVGVPLVLVFSSAQLRWSPRHVKDDYRSAVLTAVKALDAGRDVWWSANPEAAAYYGLPTARAVRRAGKATVLSLDLPERNVMLPVPDMIITSRPEIHDPSGQIAQLIATKHFRATRHFKAFTVWER